MNRNEKINIEKDLKNIIDIMSSDIDKFEGYKLLLYCDNDSVLDLLLSSFFSRFEGFSSSADKANYCIKMLKKTIEEKKYYSLQEVYDIEKYPQMKEYEGQIAYWCPESFKTTKELLDFVIAYLSLDFKILLPFLKKLQERKN